MFDLVQLGHQCAEFDALSTDDALVGVALALLEVLGRVLVEVKRDTRACVSMIS